MNINNILETINSVRYESVEEVIIPTSHLVQLRAEILALRKGLFIAHKERNKAVSEGLKILADSEPIIQRFDSYA